MAAKGACTKLALGNLQGAVGTWDREAETRLVLRVGCEPWDQGSGMVMGHAELASRRVCSPPCCGYGMLTQNMASPPLEFVLSSRFCSG